MGDFHFWFGLVAGVLLVVAGVVVIVRRKIIAARSPSNPRWHVSERFVLIEGIVLIAGAALTFASRLLF